MVNRRERMPDGRTVLGWNPGNLADRQLGAMQVRRPDGSAICTLVTFGCHPVTTGYDMTIYSADYPGPLRDLVRQVSGRRVRLLPGVGRQHDAQGRLHR